MTGFGKNFLLGATTVLGCAAASACTSWAIHPSVSKSGMMLLQKSRDSQFESADELTIKLIGEAQ